MKTSHHFASHILALALFAWAPGAFAQTSGVPGSMSYQGRISDASGNLVGSPTPVNRTVIFRVWDSPTATTPASLLYSEQQVVTIASGEFNVLVGQGLQVGTEPKPAFDSVFSGAQRFLGVTVDDGTAAADPEITPRQQLVTSAFAFRARTAEGVPTNAITSSMLAAGAVNAVSIALNAIDSSKLAPGAVTAASIAPNTIDSSKLAAGAVTAAGIAANAVDNSKLADASVNAAKLDPAIGVWSTQGSNVYRSSGRVGVGTASPGAPVQINVASGTGGEALRLTGASRASGVDPVDGCSLVLGVNLTNEREIWIADTARINKASDNAMIRLGLLAAATGCNYIDSLDNGVVKNLALNPLNGGGNVGIHTFFPVQATLHVEGSGFFSGQLISANFVTISDARVKSIVGRSNPHSDLESIRKLQVTDYRLLEGKTPGDTVQKGFIAQEVRQIVPEAVKKLEKRAIPSVNAPARTATHDPAAKSLRIVLEKAHGLKKGDTVQLTSDKKSWEVMVSETPDATSFVAGPVEAPIPEVFVYGKVVDDFLTVDYNRLFTTGLGAIQDLASQVDAIKAENAELRAKLAASEVLRAELEAADKARDARLAAIEKVLRSGGGAVVTAVVEKKDRVK